MPQLPLFEDVPQSQPIARSISQRKPRSSHLSANRTQQIPLTQAIAPATRSPQRPPAPQPAAPPACPIAPVAPTLKQLPQGWVDPADLHFDYLKNCRLCGAPIKIGGLDHSLCSGDCGWVVDLQWLAWSEAHRKKRKEPEPQAATHTSKDSGFETLDLFTYGLEGGEA